MASCSVYKSSRPLEMNPFHTQPPRPMGPSTLPPPAPVEPRADYNVAPWVPRLPPLSLWPTARRRQSEVSNRSSLDFILDHGSATPASVSASTPARPSPGSPQSSVRSPLEQLSLDQRSRGEHGQNAAGTPPNYVTRPDNSRDGAHYEYGTGIPESRARYHDQMPRYDAVYDSRARYDDGGYRRHDDGPRRYEPLEPPFRPEPRMQHQHYEPARHEALRGPGSPAGPYGAPEHHNVMRVPSAPPPLAEPSLGRPGDGLAAGPAANETPRPRKRRGNLPKEATDLMREWLLTHLDEPFPTDDEKREMEAKTKLQPNQVANWFINARRRFLDEARAEAGLPPMPRVNGGRKGGARGKRSASGTLRNTTPGPGPSPPLSSASSSSSATATTPSESPAASTTAGSSNSSKADDEDVDDGSDQVEDPDKPSAPWTKRRRLRGPGEGQLASPPQTEEEEGGGGEGD